MLQHKSKDSCLFGLWLDAIQSVLMMCKIKRVMDGLEQGLDIIVTLILFQDRLPYRRRYHERLVRKMIHMDLPWGLLKVNRAPSLRMGKAVRKLAQPRTSKGHYAHFCNWAQRIHHPLDPPDGPFPRIRPDNWDNPLHGFISPIESKTRILGTNRRHLFPTLWHSIASFNGLMMRQG
jgi:hypothetical protein